MRQLITRVDDALAQAVKERAASTGESVNSYVTRLLTAAVGGRQAWKRDALASGRLVSRPGRSSAATSPPVSVRTGYASELVSADRDDR